MDLAQGRTDVAPLTADARRASDLSSVQMRTHVAAKMAPSRESPAQLSYRAMMQRAGVTVRPFDRDRAMRVAADRVLELRAEDELRLLRRNAATRAPSRISRRPSTRRAPRRARVSRLTMAKAGTGDGDPAPSDRRTTASAREGVQS